MPSFKKDDDASLNDKTKSRINLLIYSTADTKRNALSQTSKLFNPLKLVLPVTIGGLNIVITNTECYSI